jgi:hypothetical protein
VRLSDDKTETVKDIANALPVGGNRDAEPYRQNALSSAGGGSGIP